MFQVGGCEALFGELSPPMPPRSDRTVRFLCLIFILRFHSFTDKIASHVAVKELNTGSNEHQKKASVGVRF